jgi:hypothetical protein
VEKNQPKMDIKCPLKAHVLQTWSPTCGGVGRWWKLEEVVPSGRKLSHKRCDLEGDIGT